MRTSAVAAAVTACLLATAFAGASSAQTTGGSFACGDPNIQPLGKIYGKSRGSTFCNDGAKATVLIAGKPKLTLVGGVCWRNKTNRNLVIGIGSYVINDLRKSDPAGLVLTDTKPGDVVGDTLGLSKGRFDWTGPVKVKLTGKTKGTFTATPVAAKVNGKLSGSFTCKRILDAPDQ